MCFQAWLQTIATIINCPVSNKGRTIAIRVEVIAERNSIKAIATREMIDTAIAAFLAPELSIR